MPKERCHCIVLAMAAPTQENRFSYNEAQRRPLRRMKVFATGLLVVMAAAYAVSKALEHRFPALAVMTAFTEAAMVGALADWFAVVALFRHPLRIPIPKTAIIPRNKDRIGEALARFLREHFLAREVLERKLASVDLTGSVAGWLAQKRNAVRLANAFGDHMPAILERFRDQDLQAFVREEAAANLGKVRFAPLLAGVLRPLAQGNMHQELLTELLGFASRLLSDNKEKIREITRKESPRYIPDFIDEKIYNLIVGKVEEILGKVQLDPDHEARTKLSEALNRFLDNVEHSPEFSEKAETLKTEFLQHPKVKEYMGTLWQGVKARLVANLADPESTTRKQIAHSLNELGRALKRDEAVREKVNHWLRTWAVTAISENRDLLVGFIAETFRKWDPIATSRRIELSVGKDLQWIRINGTVIGGLVGLLIYVATRLLNNAF